MFRTDLGRLTPRKTLTLFALIICLVALGAPRNALASSGPPSQGHVATAVQLEVRAPVPTVWAAPMRVAAQDDPGPLPDFFVQLMGFVLAIGTGIYGIITLTGLGKWLAEQFGIHIEGNQVRAVSAGAGVVMSLVIGALRGLIPGVAALPWGGTTQAWLAWVVISAPTMILFANAIWRAYYKPEPAPLPVLQA